MAKKSNLSMFRPALKLSVLVTGTAFGLMACSDSGGEAADDGPSTGPSTTTSGSTTGGTITSGTTASAVTSGTTSAVTSGTTASAVTSGTTASAVTSGTTGGTTMGSTTTGTMMGAGGTSSGTDGTSTGAGGTGATTADDFDPMAEDFTCIADWQKILGFRINNFLGKLDEAVAVAQDPAGGVYPVGTILQHFPTEAMVKRKAGFSPESKDWEFFLLTLNADGTATIAERGTTDIATAQGATCVSCHTLADDQWDFVCNTYGNAGSANCGFDLTDQQIDQQISTDPRCD